MLLVRLRSTPTLNLLEAITKCSTTTPKSPSKPSTHSKGPASLLDKAPNEQTCYSETASRQANVEKLTCTKNTQRTQNFDSNSKLEL